MGRVLIDLGAGQNSIEIVGDHTVRGRELHGRCFIAEFSRPFKAFGTFHQNQPQLDGARVRRDDSVSPNSRSDSGSYAGTYLEFSTAAGEKILVRIASARSFETAQKQLDEDHSDFDTVHQHAESLWNAKLNLIEIKGGTEHERELFYSTLYNSLLTPWLLAKKGSVIHQRDGETRLAQYDRYSPIAFWDKRSLTAGVEWLELHFAHGYLAHEFLSPISNHRTDKYGGSFENRVRFAIETARAVRAVWPEHLPYTARISATDWVDGGWNIQESVELAKLLKAEGLDLIDCSTGGNVPNAVIPIGPGYQVQFAERVRKEAAIPTAAVGFITEAKQADEIIRQGRADLVLLAREFLREPYWPRLAAIQLGHKNLLPIPNQYARAW